MTALHDVARKFMAACARGANASEYFGYGKLAHLFKNAEKDTFSQFDKHTRKHATLPSIELLGQWWDKVPPTPEPASYYMTLLRNRHFENVLSKTIDEANELVQKDESEKAALLIMDKLAPELLRRHGNRLIGVVEAYELVKANYFQQMHLGDDYGVRLGYPVVDEYGGLVPGDVMSLVGRPAAGKSFLQLRGAHYAWRHGHSPCFISMEMNNLVSGQRLVALDAGIPLNGLKLQKGHGLTTTQITKLEKAMQAAKKAAQPFHLMDGNLSTTVEDIYAFCRQMKPTVLFLDGAYMLKHPNPRLGRFERVAENCELLKQQIAGDLGIPVVASWQFSRQAAVKMGNKKKKETVGLEDIGYSDAIGQISTIVLGMLEEETIETMHRKTVTIMKGRNGETGEFQINWQFTPTLNFDVWVEPELNELSFL